VLASSRRARLYALAGSRVLCLLTRNEEGGKGGTKGLDEFLRKRTKKNVERARESQRERGTAGVCDGDARPVRARLRRRSARRAGALPPSAQPLALPPAGAVPAQRIQQTPCSLRVPRVRPDDGCSIGAWGGRASLLRQPACSLCPPPSPPSTPPAASVHSFSRPVDPWPFLRRSRGGRRRGPGRGSTTRT
jgi:hypothetical protein